MDGPVLLLHGVLLGFLGLAAVGDVRAHRISNRLILSGLVVAFAFHLAFSGGAGVWRGVLGMLTGLGLLLPFYVLRGMAAGDVKLMAMVGVFIGPQSTLLAAVVSFLVGGVWSLVVVSRQRAWSSVFATLLQWRYGLGQSNDGGSAPAKGTRDLVGGAPLATSVGYLPYGAVIATGTVIVLLLQWYGGSLGVA